MGEYLIVLSFLVILSRMDMLIIQWPCGTTATSRAPRRQRPYCRTMLVFVQVSSIKMSLAAFGLGLFANPDGARCRPYRGSPVRPRAPSFLRGKPSSASVVRSTLALTETSCSSTSQSRNSAKVTPAARSACSGSLTPANSIHFGFSSSFGTATGRLA